MNKTILVSIIVVVIVVLIGGYFIYNAYQSPASKTITPSGTNTPQQSEAEKSCLSSGGQVVTAMCCQTAGDFPNSCLIGACGCAPAYSHQVKSCDCGPNKCFDGIGCISASGATNQQQTPPPQNLNASVSIKNFTFNPTPLTIKVGTTVTWTNNDPVTHQIKSNTFNSSPLSSGQTFQFTFSTAGQYDYSCAIHPSMHGKIIVTQ